MAGCAVYSSSQDPRTQVKPAIADDSARMAELEAKFRTLATYEGPKQLLVEHAWGPPVYADRARGYNYGE